MKKLLPIYTANIPLLMLEFLRRLLVSKQIESVDNMPTEFPQYTAQAIRLIIESDGQLEDEQILSLFEKNGIPPQEAVELLLFLPQAFCRHLLSEVKWPNYYLEYISGTKSTYIQATEYILLSCPLCRLM